MRIVWMVIDWTCEPRRLLAVAAFLAVLGLLGGYATLHENANRALALRLGPPAPVAVQDFRTSSIGPAQEVLIRAETDLTAPLIFRHPTRQAETGALVLPLFPVGGTGDMVAGALILPLSDHGASADVRRLVEVLGPSRAGSVIEVNGQRVEAGDYTLMLAGALAARGAQFGSGFVAVRPFSEGRAVALQPNVNPSRAWIWVLGTAGALVAVAAWRAFWPSAWAGLVTGRRAEPRQPVAAPPRTGPFAPLRTADDLAAVQTRDMLRLSDATRGALTAAAVVVGLGMLRGMGAAARLLLLGVARFRSPR
jgi:hypothetical protein